MSEKVFTVPDTTSGKPVPLCDIEKLPTQTFITVEVKVRSVNELRANGLAAKK